MSETILDRAHAAMEAAPFDDDARLRFYHRIADAELFLLLESEPTGDEITPKLFELDAGRFVMAFDLEERLAEFCEKPAPYVALPGRVIAGALAGQETGIGLNLGVAPSAFLMTPEALEWLTGTLAEAPQLVEARPMSFGAPAGLPAILIEALENRFAELPGMAKCALLASVRYEGGRLGHILAFEGADTISQAALAKTVSETLVFSGVDAGELDVAFLAAGVSAPEGLRRVAHRFDIPAGQVVPAPISNPSAPGMDPSRPPKLR